MNPGKLDIYGYIEYDVGTTKNASGEPVHHWHVYSPVWCQRFEDSGKEVASADEIVGFQTAKFKIRYDSDVKPKMRLIISSEIWNITEVNYSDRHYMVLTAVKKDNEVYVT